MPAEGFVVIGRIECQGCGRSCGCEAEQGPDYHMGFMLRPRLPEGWRQARFPVLGYVCSEPCQKLAETPAKAG